MDMSPGEASGLRSQELLKKVFLQRSPLTWVSIALAVVSFIAIFAGEPYNHYEPVARWGNASGAALVFGAAPWFIVWLVKRTRARVRMRSESPCVGYSRIRW